MLPATTQLEHLDVHTLRPHRRAADQPAGHLRRWAKPKPNTQIFRELAAAMGFDEPCFRDDDETLARGLQPSWTSGAAPRRLGEAARAGGAVSPRAASSRPRASAASTAPAWACPDFVPNHESAGTPALAQRYPLAMISPPARNFLNSTFVSVKSLRDIEAEPLVEIHRPTLPRGIADVKHRAPSTTAAATAARPR